MESAMYDGVLSKRIGPNEREISYMKGGKPVYTAHSKVAADGNSMTVLGKGVNAAGVTVDATGVYDKVK